MPDAFGCCRSGDEATDRATDDHESQPMAMLGISPMVLGIRTAWLAQALPASIGISPCGGLIADTHSSSHMTVCTVI